MLEKHCQVMLLSEPAAAARGTKVSPLLSRQSTALKPPPDPVVMSFAFLSPTSQPIVIGHEEAEFTRRQVGSDQALAFQASVYFDTIARLDKGAWKE